MIPRNNWYRFRATVEVTLDITMFGYPTEEAAREAMNEIGGRDLMDESDDLTDDEYDSHGRRARIADARYKGAVCENDSE